MSKRVNCPTVDWKIFADPERLTPSFDDAEVAVAGFIGSQVENMISCQRQALAYTEELLSSQLDNCSIVDLGNQLRSVRSDFGSSAVPLYRSIISSLSLALDTSAEADVLRVIGAFQKMLDLLVKRLESASSIDELCEAATGLIDWVDNAPASFRLWLDDMGFSPLQPHVDSEFRHCSYRTNAHSDGGIGVFADSETEREVAANVGREDIPPVHRGSGANRRCPLEGFFAA